MSISADDQTWVQGASGKGQPWYRKITVEPTLFLYMMSHMLTSVVEQVFYVYKACTVNHGYGHNVCANIEHYQEIKKEVQVTTSTFLMWNHIAMNVVPIALAFFLGPWSDKRGRKLPLLLGLVGKLIHSIMIMINTKMDWPLEYVIYTATIPSVFTGAGVAIFGSCFAYITDVTTASERTMRIAILEASFLSTMPVGVALGNVLFNLSNKSFFLMYVINASLLLVSMLYSITRLQSRTTERQVSIRELRWYQIPGDIFDKEHVVHSLKTLFKKRPMDGRFYLYILMAATAFYTFQRDERPMIYLYTQLKFNWNTDKYSYFRTYQSTMYVMMLIIGVPFFLKLLKMRDTFIIMIGVAAHAIARFFYIFAEVDWLLYVGATVSSLGPIVAAVLRSMISKIVTATERGTIFSLLSIFDDAVVLISGVLYTQVYNAFIDSYPAAFFWLTMATQGIVFLLIMGVHIFLRGKSLEEDTTDTTMGDLNGTVQKKPAGNEVAGYDNEGLQL
ncbi:proton-coupled folate transporter-like isoform X1 [Uranotaenia lowii]|uniref:proton-coupled folate transporter-like isoform X1 n=1 Tax=Uranotaenia lowii TaxID=190385 RepID=UPI0024793510|nr:proton-coupled folate transporter-like isoform X1 [Uranotaenia lowii]